MDEPFIADIFSSLPQNADPSAIRSAQDYIFLQQVLRTPTLINKEGQVEGDFLESWSLDRDNKEFELILKEDLLWSDGKKITAEDFIKSIQRQIKLGTSTHYNFSEIKEVSHLGEYAAKIVLKNTNTHFLKQLAYPEFGLIRNCEKDRISFDDLKVSSGPYLCESADMTQIILSHNPNYEFIDRAPRRIILQSSEVNKQLEGLKTKKIGLVIPSKSLSRSEHETIKNNKRLQVYDPRIGFTFWISINANSSVFKVKKNRRYIQSILANSDIPFSDLEPIWQKANQLYLPGGLGRPTSEIIELIWEQISKAKKQKIENLSLLISEKFPFLKPIKKTLNDAGIDVRVETYRDLNEFTSLCRGQAFDLIQINTDFSSLDVSENILVALNENRPLVFVGNDAEKYKDLQLSLISQRSSEETYIKTADIGVALLEDGYIFPIAYYKTYFYLQKNADISAWSQEFPDVKFWKMRLESSVTKAT